MQFVEFITLQMKTQGFNNTHHLARTVIKAMSLIVVVAIHYIAMLGCRMYKIIKKSKNKNAITFKYKEER